MSKPNGNAGATNGNASATNGNAAATNGDTAALNASQKSYGTYKAMEQYENAMKKDLASTVRSRSSTRVSLNSYGIPAGVLCDIEDIFSRADEGVPLLEKLGGVAGVAEKLQTDVHKGIHGATAERRRADFGANRLPEDPPLTFWKIYKATWNDRMIQLLAAAAVVSLILGLTVPDPGEKKVNYKTGWVEGFAILCSVVVVTTVSSVNDYRKEQKFHALTLANAAQPVRVLRDGKLQVIDVTELVVGDVMSLSPGLVVPVDGLYLRGLSVVIDESSVTGENDPKRKNEKAPILLSGTVVSTAEDAYILTCAVGECSFGGKLLMESRQTGTPRPTPLQERLDGLADTVGRIGMIVAAGLFVILAAIEVVRLAKQYPEASAKRLLDYFLLCVTIVVIAVPEGLPLAVTIALAYSQSKMHDDNNQVRRLRACETMGNATQICSDKTGTLTQNMMSVVQGYVGMTYFLVRHPGDLPEPIELAASVKSQVRALLTEGIAINSSSEKVVQDSDREGHSVAPYWQWMPDKGNKTDNALLDFIDRVLLSEADAGDMTSRPHQRLREQCRQRGFAVFPFTSDRKRMSAVVRQEDGTLIHHVKGGSDRILPLCDRYLNDAGEELPLTDKVRDLITAQLRSFSIDANRTIGVAYTRLNSKELPEEEPTEMLVWVGLLGIQDPLRPEVSESVRKCQMAGVVVRMCTGDNLDTAMTIARQCGIYNRAKGDVAMTGKDFRNLVYDAYGNEERMAKFWPVLDRMTVMARSQPLDKQLLVLMLMTRGEVVAVTGDGTNDAPALRLADVGFVMRSGTDIAVKSADIVLLDDNFHSVQRAVVWGRCVNDNIRKFLQLQLTVNYTSVALTCIGSIVARGASSPLTTVQLLWVNLIMDTLAALALATEEPSEACLKRGPVNRRAPLVSRRMNITIGIVAVYQLVLTLTAQYLAPAWLAMSGPRGVRQAHTFVFNLFVLGILFQMINCRKLYEEVDVFEGFERSSMFIYVVSFCVLFQIIAVQTFGDFMNVTALTFAEWLVCLALSMVTLFLGMASRFIPIEEPHYEKVFDPDNVDEDAKASLARLAAEVELNADQHAAQCGAALRTAQHARVLRLWYCAYVRYVETLKVINAFRRARVDRDMGSDVSRRTYIHMRQLCNFA